MERMEYTMLLSNFFADENFGEGTFEKIVDRTKIKMLEKLYFDRLKGKDKDNFIISFHNVYWDEFKINQKIDTLLRITNGLYKNPTPSKQSFIDRAEAYKLIEDKKPFDIVLVIQTREEFVEELLKTMIKMGGINNGY